MCDGHSDVPVSIGGSTVGVDGCIAQLVKALNDAGYRTLASCCGHGKQPATIPLLDLDGVERWLILTADRAEGERLMWPVESAGAAGPQATPDQDEQRDEIESLKATLAELDTEAAASSRVASAMAEAIGWRTPGETWVDKAAYLRPLAAELLGKRELRDAREGIKPEGGFHPDWTVHPGEMLRDELDERGMTQTELAGAVGHSLKHVNQVCRGHVPVTAAFAIRLERVLGPSAEVWLRMQMAYDLHHARRVVAVPTDPKDQT